MRLVIPLGIPLLLAASVASAGIDLTWNGCAADGAASTLDFNCGDPGFQAYLVGSFNMPAAYDSFYALDVTIDVGSETATLPAFWNFTAGSGCNATGLTRQLFRPAGCATTTNVWGTNGVDGNGTYVYLTPFAGSARRARLMASFFRTTPTSVDLAAGTDYFGFSFLISVPNAVEAGGTCAGCPTPVVFLWNSATFFSDTRPDLEVITPGTVGLCVRANGAGSATCDAVPVRRSTWGTIKSLYR